MRCPICSTSLPDHVQVCSECGSAWSTGFGQTTVAGSAQLQFTPGAVFADRYTIIEKVAEGGMGIVYKAIDNSLGGQEVALKIIRPELAGYPEYVTRFRREVRVARDIEHPNVCRVYDLGDHEGVLFLSMRWIRGETLRNLLNQAGRLDETRALEIAGKIARGLAEAHAHGVVHRDLKPGNVMIDEHGEVYVMDFGLATDPESGDESRPSILGGTPAYMSPEQERGEKVDARTDLYALGLILQEMLTGRRPGTQDEGESDTKSTVTSRVAPILENLLVKDRTRRYSSAIRVGEELDGIRRTRGFGASLADSLHWATQNRARAALRVAAVIAIVVAGWYLFVRPPNPDDPLKNLVTPAEAYYERGMHYLREETETVQNLDAALQMFHRAIAKDSSFALAWAALGETYWIRFAYTKEETSREEAKKAVERSFELEPGLLQARHARARGLIAEGGFETARSILAEIVDEDPEYDVAWANLGRAYRGLGEYSRGLAAHQKAIQLKPDDFQHRMLLGNFYVRFKENEAAIAAYQDAIDLKPDSPMAWNNLGTVYLRTGDLDHSAEAFERSLAIRERASARTNLGNVYYFKGEYERAVENFRKAAEIEPNNPTYWGNLGDAYQVLGRSEQARDSYLEAVALARKTVELTPNVPGAHIELGLWCARAGEEECALSEGSLAAEMQPDDAEILFLNATIRCILDRPEEALDWLERAVRLGVSKARFESDPDFADVRELPHYQRVLELAS